MKLHLIGHACVVAECSDTSILMDPWLSGKIFNNSWTLRPEPVLDPAVLDRIDYYLKPKYVFITDFMTYVRSRLAGGMTQAVHYYRTSL